MIQTGALSVTWPLAALRMRSFFRGGNCLDMICCVCIMGVGGQDGYCQRDGNAWRTASAIACFLQMAPVNINSPSQLVDECVLCIKCSLFKSYSSSSGLKDLANLTNSEEISLQNSRTAYDSFTVSSFYLITSNSSIAMSYFRVPSK